MRRWWADEAWELEQAVIAVDYGETGLHIQMQLPLIIGVAEVRGLGVVVE